MQDLKADRTMLVNNINFRLNKMKERLDYYRTLNDPQEIDVNSLAKIECSLEQFLNNE